MFSICPHACLWLICISMMNVSIIMCLSPPEIIQMDEIQGPKVIDASKHKFTPDKDWDRMICMSVTCLHLAYLAFRDFYLVNCGTGHEQRNRARYLRKTQKSIRETRLMRGTCAQKNYHVRPDAEISSWLLKTTSHLALGLQL